MDLREKLTLINTIAPPVRGLTNSVLMELKTGSALAIGGQQFVVEDSFLYTETNKKGVKKKFTWKEYQLRNLSTFEIVFLEVEDDDGLSAYLTLEKVAEGRISPSPGPSVKQIEVSGLGDGTFYLDETCYAVFDGKHGEENVVMLDYEDDHGTLLGVEIWDGDNGRAYTYKEVSVKPIEVIAHEGD